MAFKRRNQLLPLFIALFLVLGPVTVLYAYGWRVNLENFEIVKIGGIFVKNFPAESVMKLNNEKLDNYGQKFLTGRLLDGLLPGEYKLEIEKFGFKKWEKIINVDPAMVSETNPVVLIPSEINPEKISGGDIEIIFNDLKNSILKFPGYVPIEDLKLQEHPYLWLINSAKASYLIDVDKMTIEILPEKILIPKIKLSEKEEAIIAKLTQKIPGKVVGVSRYRNFPYLFVQYTDSIYFLEVDDRDPLNFSFLAVSKKHVYADGKLYLINQNGINFLEI
ncbi:MAG: hypothetical protein HYT03_03360 [Candidatus Harrisonbacteria bacterium]|nr:hypothetical protein [Candidatus Harrisonbacteria bacterium]